MSNFDYDTAMADPDNRVFTNINPRNPDPAEVAYDYNLDDFGSQVLPDD